jgi:hypothetical protein
MVEEKIVCKVFKLILLVEDRRFGARRGLSQRRKTITTVSPVDRII